MGRLGETGLKEKGALLTTLVDLTSKEKADKYFESLEVEKHKAAINPDALRLLSTEELDVLYGQLEAKDSETHKKNMKSAYDRMDKTSQKKSRNSQYESYFKSKRFQFFMELKRINRVKKNNYHDIDNLARRIVKNNTITEFSKNLDSGLQIDLRAFKLRITDFTEKEILRLYDFSLNNSKKRFGK